MTTTVAITVTSGIPASSGSKTYSMSDPHFQQVLDWIEKTQLGSLPVNPTNQQLILAWLDGFINQTKRGTQQSGVVTTVPPPIDVT